MTSPDTVSDLSHQDVFVADEKGSTRVCLWGDHISTLKEGQSYKLADFTVREFRSKKYLNMPKSGADVTPITDLGKALHLYKKTATCNGKLPRMPLPHCSLPADNIMSTTTTSRRVNVDINSPYRENADSMPNPNDFYMYTLFVQQYMGA